MREIKIRVWMDKVKYMSKQIRLFNKQDDMFSSCFIMQWTGIKDKNGVEIYEGDIVRDLSSLHVTAGSPPFSGSHPLTEVKYMIGRKYQKNPLYGDVGYNISSGSEYEVIGNIYENQELLKEERNG